MGAKRNPSVYATWLPPFLVGDRSCEWSVWYRALYYLDEKATTFDVAKYKMQHTPLLINERARLEADGYTVYQEDQNSFKLVRSDGTELAGKPDLVGISADGKNGIVVDAKTGQPYDYHSVQVLLYMWALPRAFPEWRHIKFEGRVAYKEDDAVVPASAVNQAFRDNVVELVNRVVARDVPAVRVPSPRECSFCPITSSICEQRVEGGVVALVYVDEF
jgi:hypothetical protein